MLNLDTDLAWISDRYQALFGQFSPRCDHILLELILPVIADLARGDAPYHQLDHTLQVARVGQWILEGKQQFEGTLSPVNWLQIMVSLFCHDIGYVKGIFERDNCVLHHYFDGDQGQVKLHATATGAALANQYIDRSKAYVSLHLTHPKLDHKLVQDNIETMRFPMPLDDNWQRDTSHGSLCRAAALLGQLSDPFYLQKLPALFQEFAETGINQVLGYDTFEALRNSYPSFFWQMVYPDVKDSLRYLSATAPGRRAIAQLYTNLYLSEVNQPLCDTTHLELQQLRDETALLSWQEAGFIFNPN